MNPRDVAPGRRGYELLNDPLLNKGIAFTEAERDAFDLHGLLPPYVGTLDEQVARWSEALRACVMPLERYAFMRDLQDINETIFYRLLTQNLDELLPVVYTPAVGAGCERFSNIYRKPRGLFLSLPNRSRLDSILAHERYDGIEAIVVTDGERILGLGDQGAGGMGIPVGKLSLYTACGGLHPSTTLPILLDVGTANASLLADPLYLGWRHDRVRGAEYDDFLEAFVTAVQKRWPFVLLQWEDFARENATQLLERYRDRLCTFNDDIQGTAAVTFGTLLAAVTVTGVPLAQQRVVIAGAGSAGCGIATMIARGLTEAGLDAHEVRDQIAMVDRQGLLIDDMPDLQDFQRPFAQARAASGGWGKRELADVVHHLRPTVLIGVSGQPGIFTEALVKSMAANVARPVIMPLSNPTSRCEATAADLLEWTDGRALVGTGSPSKPVTYGGRTVTISQTNNAFVFPGIGLGVIASRAHRVTDAMFMAAAKALAGMSPARTDPLAPLLPPVARLREVALTVASAVALQAHREGLVDAIGEESIRARMWQPEYRAYRRN
jgi:malate dehydrogenase (oxaloacetate-decarboxylating)